MPRVRARPATLPPPHPRIQSPAMMGDPDQVQDSLLRDAKASADALVARLSAQRDGLASAGHSLPDEQRSLGLRAFARAIEAARRTADGIHRASEDRANVTPPLESPHRD